MAKSLFDQSDDEEDKQEEEIQVHIYLVISLIFLLLTCILVATSYRSDSVIGSKLLLTWMVCPMIPHLICQMLIVYLIIYLLYLVYKLNHPNGEMVFFGKGIAPSLKVFT
jgi:uncharacterized Tic20 family protein